MNRRFLGRHYLSLAGVLFALVILLSELLSNKDPTTLIIAGVGGLGAILIGAIKELQNSDSQSKIDESLQYMAPKVSDIDIQLRARIPGLEARAEKWERVARLVHEFQHHGLISLDRLPTKGPGNAYFIHVFTWSVGYAKKSNVSKNRAYPGFLERELNAIRMPLLHEESRSSSTTTFFTADAILPKNLRSAQALHDYIENALPKVFKAERDEFARLVEKGDAEEGRGSVLRHKDWRKGMPAIVWVQPLHLNDSRLALIHDPPRIPDLMRLFDESNDICFSKAEQARIRDFVYGQDFSFVMEGEHKEAVDAFNACRMEWDMKFQCKTIFGYERVEAERLLPALSNYLEEDYARQAIERLQTNLKGYREALEEINVRGLRMLGNSEIRPTTD